MSLYLLDTNVLIALAWPNHVHHWDARDWFERKGSTAFRTCPITETGFVRISSNPAFTAEAASPTQAMALLDRITELPGWGFWPDDIPLAAAFPARSHPVSHRLVTDGYLLALAKAHGGVLATLDRGIGLLTRQDPERVEFLLKRA
jgi:toxin-antitoxin system PIN domain toxin